MTFLLAVMLMSSMPQARDVVTIARGTLSGIERSRQAVVQDQAEWSRLWHEHAPDTAQPKVDFTTRTVVAVFLGTRTTAGFDVEITAVDRQGSDVTVRYRETRPSGDQMVAQVMTSPFHIVAVPRVDGAVRYVKERSDER